MRPFLPAGAGAYYCIALFHPRESKLTHPLFDQQPYMNSFDIFINSPSSKSTEKHIKQIQTFRAHEFANEHCSIEQVLLEYFDHVTQQCASATLWSIYSVINKYIQLDRKFE